MNAVNKLDRAQFSEVWRSTLDFYGKTATPESLKLVFAALADYSIEQVRLAISRHMADTEIGQWPPKPADVIRAIEGRIEDRAAVAWSKVRPALSGVGSYQSVVFDDDRIHCAIKALGGWVAVCSGDEEALVFLEKDFNRHYRAAVATGMPHPKVLHGIEARDNIEEPVPVLIGDHNKCLEVYKGGSDRIESGIRKLSLEMMP